MLQLRFAILHGIAIFKNSGIGNRYVGLLEAVKSGTLNTKQMKECQAFAKWYKDIVVSHRTL